MNYIGSKLSLLNFLEESINKVVDKKCHIFCDLFAGTGIVGNFFKKRGYKIIANDIQYYSYVLNKHYVGNHRELYFKRLVKELPGLNDIKIADRKKYVCNYLENLSGVRGFIYRNYCLGGTKNKNAQRQYFSDENGMECDAIRQRIEEWKNKKLINKNEYFFLLATLIESIDKYANTASIYGAFLKGLKRSAQKKMILRPLDITLNDQDHKVYNENINTVIKKIK